MIIAAAVGAWTCSQKLAFASVNRAYNGATSPTEGARQDRSVRPKFSDNCEPRHSLIRAVNMQGDDDMNVVVHDVRRVLLQLLHDNDESYKTQDYCVWISRLRHG